jgi:hypothetical protein
MENVAVYLVGCPKITKKTKYPFPEDEKTSRHTDGSRETTLK